MPWKNGLVRQVHTVRMEKLRRVPSLERTVQRSRRRRRHAKLARTVRTPPSRLNVQGALTVLLDRLRSLIALRVTSVRHRRVRKNVKVERSAQPEVSYQQKLVLGITHSMQAERLQRYVQWRNGLVR